MAAPGVTTNAATGSVPNGVTFNGTLDSTGGKATQTKFQYGLTISYGTETALSATVVGAFTATVGSLTPGVTYHYRAVATNADGTTNGGDQTFVLATTMGAPAVYLGLSTDTKPTGVAVGSRCYETDTKLWYLTADGSTWTKLSNAAASFAKMSLLSQRPTAIVNPYSAGGTPYKCCLHCHTAYPGSGVGDGSKTPQEVADALVVLGYHVMARTDHYYYAAADDPTGIVTIPGVEEDDHSKSL